MVKPVDMGQVNQDVINKALALSWERFYELAKKQHAIADDFVWTKMWYQYLQSHLERIIFEVLKDEANS